jgi:tRNA (cmo5U34)-methyltransferase|tara:strand:- start:207 stop:932 length:726 start_codon:yes stop_codon:yes gene_type:complete
MHDNVYVDKQQHIVDFAFNKDVVAVFPDMIRRSVPGYETIIPMTGLIAARHLGGEGTAYDLGCSLGASTLAILQQSQAANIRVIGVDNSPAMIEEAQNQISDPRATFQCADLLSTRVQDAKVVVLNFVAQFLAPEERLALFTRLREEMHPNGLLIVSEKVRNANVATQSIFDETHLNWKRANGYSEIEVSQKRQALENVMKVDTEEMQRLRFQEAGFTKSKQWFRCLNWASFLVYKRFPTS